MPKFCHCRIACASCTVGDNDGETVSSNSTSSGQQSRSRHGLTASLEQSARAPLERMPTAGTPTGGTARIEEAIAVAPSTVGLSSGSRPTATAPLSENTPPVAGIIAARPSIGGTLRATGPSAASSRGSPRGAAGADGSSGNNLRQAAKVPNGSSINNASCVAEAVASLTGVPLYRGPLTENPTHEEGLTPRLSLGGLSTGTSPRTKGSPRTQGSPRKQGPPRAQGSPRTQGSSRAGPPVAGSSAEGSSLVGNSVDKPSTRSLRAPSAAAVNFKPSTNLSSVSGTAAEPPANSPRSESRLIKIGITTELRLGPKNSKNRRRDLNEITEVLANNHNTLVGPNHPRMHRSLREKFVGHPGDQGGRQDAEALTHGGLIRREEERDYRRWCLVDSELWPFDKDQSWCKPPPAPFSPKKLCKWDATDHIH
jgi:hypothetical protein